MARKKAAVPALRKQPLKMGDIQGVVQEFTYGIEGEHAGTIRISGKTYQVTDGLMRNIARHFKVGDMVKCGIAKQQLKNMVLMVQGYIEDAGTENYT